MKNLTIALIAATSLLALTACAETVPAQSTAITSPQEAAAKRAHDGRVQQIQEEQEHRDAYFERRAAALSATN